MTASLHRLGAGAAAGLYYTNDSAREARPSRRDEYYAKDGGGVWWSSGESVVRHGAAIDIASFRDLCAGKDPRAGKALVRGAGEGHWAGVDITFTPGKSVSVLWMAGTPEQRERIEKAHDEAVDRALRFILDEKLIAVRQQQALAAWQRGLQHLFCAGPDWNHSPAQLCRPQSRRSRKTSTARQRSLRPQRSIISFRSLMRSCPRSRPIPTPLCELSWKFRRNFLRAPAKTCGEQSQKMRGALG